VGRGTSYEQSFSASGANDSTVSWFKVEKVRAYIFRSIAGRTLHEEGRSEGTEPQRIVVRNILLEFVPTTASFRLIIANHTFGISKSILFFYLPEGDSPMWVTFAIPHHLNLVNL
jgi:hypothetical protein